MRCCSDRPACCGGADRHAAGHRDLPGAVVDALGPADGRPAGQHHRQPGLRQPAVVHARRTQHAVHVDPGRHADRHLPVRHRGRTVARVTNTPESEYSPTVTPDGAHISVIRVEADGTQRLWRFTIDGTQPELVLADVKPVGYHAWADDHTLALFVLGSRRRCRSPTRGPGRPSVVARGIGRSIQRIPGGAHDQFRAAQRRSAGRAPTLKIRELDPKAAASRRWSTR